MSIIYKQFELNTNRFKNMNKQQKKIMAIMALERQWKVYEKCSLKREWGRNEVYRGVLDNCWKFALENKDIPEEVWNICDNNKPENILINKPDMYDDFVSYSSIFVDNLIEFIDNWLDEVDGEECFLQFNFDFIESFLECYLDDKSLIDEHELIQSEIEHQNIDYKKMKGCVNIMNIKEWFDSKSNESVLGKYWFNNKFIIK